MYSTLNPYSDNTYEPSINSRHTNVRPHLHETQPGAAVTHRPMTKDRKRDTRSRDPTPARIATGASGNRTSATRTQGWAQLWRVGAVGLRRFGLQCSQFPGMRDLRESKLVAEKNQKWSGRPLHRPKSKHIYIHSTKTCIIGPLHTHKSMDIHGYYT